MDLEVNLFPKLYKEFSEYTCDYDIYVKQMPVLIDDGQIPMNISNIMERRIEVRNAPKKVKVAWMDRCFDTGDGIVYHPNGNIKVILDSRLLRKINPNTCLNEHGGVDLTNGVYEKLEGYEIKKNELIKICDKNLTKKEAKSHPIWKALARDQNLLNDYVDYIISDGKKRWPTHVREENIMAVGIENHYQRIGPELKEWFIFHHTLGSRISGKRSFCIRNCCLVGIVEKGNSKVKILTKTELKELNKTIKNLEKFVKPEHLKLFRYLIK